jgi:hypothetical protein
MVSYKYKVRVKASDMAMVSVWFRVFVTFRARVRFMLQLEFRV